MFLSLWETRVLELLWELLLCWLYGIYMSLKSYAVTPGRVVNHFTFTPEQMNPYTSSGDREDFHMGISRDSGMKLKKRKFWAKHQENHYGKISL